MLSNGRKIAHRSRVAWCCIRHVTAIYLPRIKLADGPAIGGCRVREHVSRHLRGPLLAMILERRDKPGIIGEGCGGDEDVHG